MSNATRALTPITFAPLWEQPWLTWSVGSMTNKASNSKIKRLEFLATNMEFGWLLPSFRSKQHFHTDPVTNSLARCRGG